MVQHVPLIVILIRKGQAVRAVLNIFRSLIYLREQSKPKHVKIRRFRISKRRKLKIRTLFVCGKCYALRHTGTNNNNT